VQLLSDPNQLLAKYKGLKREHDFMQIELLKLNSQLTQLVRGQPPPGDLFASAAVIVWDYP
jgi:hypothetical protein